MSTEPMTDHRDDLLLMLLNGGAADEKHANELLDAHRAEVLAEALQAARTETERLENGDHDARAARGARSVTYLLRNLAREKSSRPAADATPGEAYPGQLAMLTGLVATLRAVAEHGDLDDVRKLLAEHQRDEQDACAETGEGQ